MQGDLLPGQGNKVPGPPAGAVLAGGVAPLPQGGADGRHHLVNGQLLSLALIVSHSRDSNLWGQGGGGVAVHIDGRGHPGGCGPQF